LAVPFTMSLTGIGLYHVIIIAVFFASFISLKWLVEVADVTRDIDVPQNYEGLAQVYLGGAADAAISAALVVGGLAITMAYMLLITTSLVSVFSEPPFNLLSDNALQPMVLLIVGLCVVLPLTMLKDISKFRYTSTLATGIMGCTATYVCVSGLSYITEHGIHKGCVVSQVTPSLFEAIPITISAYSCHMLVMPVYESLGPGRTPGMMLFVMAAAVGFSSFVYEMVGIFGYLHFGCEVQSNVLISLAETSGAGIVRILISLGMAITLICHVPLVVWPLRSCIISAYHGLCHGFETSGEEATNFEWYGATAAVIVVVLVLATMFPNVKTALSVVGSVGGAFIVFLYPAMFHLSVVKGTPAKDWLHYRNVLEVTMIGVGTVLGTVCFTMSIKNSFA